MSRRRKRHASCSNHCRILGVDYNEAYQPLNRILNIILGWQFFRYYCIHKVNILTD